MQLGELLKPGDLVCLDGELGSGKTTFVQGLAAGWGSPEQVTSPTFVLINVYRRPNGEQLFHMDAYRLENANEAEALDLDSLLEQGPLVVEWAERVMRALPAEHLRLKIKSVDTNRRHIEVLPLGERYVQKAEAFQQAVYGVA